MKKYHIKLLNLFKPQGGPKGNNDQDLITNSNSKFQCYWRDYAIECAAKDIPIKAVIERLINQIDGERLNLDAKYSSLITEVEHKRQHAIQELTPMEDNPEVFISNALDNLPKEAFTEVSRLEAKYEETMKQEKLITEKLMKLKIKYPNADIEL